MEKQYTAEECAEFAKRIAHIFDAYENYTHYSCNPRIKDMMNLLKIIEDYKRDVPEEVRKHLDNSDELSGAFETINKLEKMITRNLIRTKLEENYSGEI